MSRFKDKQTVVVEEVSQEGFLSSVAKFLGGVGAGISRANAIGLICFSPESRPEVNGVPAKDFMHLTTLLKNAIGSGGPWDATVVSRLHRSEDTGRVHEASGLPERLRIPVESVVVFIGEGSDVKIRLPSYRQNPYFGSARVARFLVDELGLKHIV